MPNPTVGIALGAGAARGMASLGVLQVLQQEGIPIDVITGTSAGAVVGSLFAVGHDLDMLCRMAKEMDWNDFVRPTISRRGLVSTEKIRGLLSTLTQERRFEDLPIPTAVVATDLLTGEEVVIKSGSIAEGVQASLSIPGVFVPVELNGRLLVDGALVNRVPADVCRERSEEHTSELQSRPHLVCRLLLEKKKNHHLSRESEPFVIESPGVLRVGHFA